jgi:hypothetical protein
MRGCFDSIIFPRVFSSSFVCAVIPLPLSFQLATHPISSKALEICFKEIQMFFDDSIHIYVVPGAGKAGPEARSPVVHAVRRCCWGMLKCSRMRSPSSQSLQGKLRLLSTNDHHPMRLLRNSHHPYRHHHDCACFFYCNANILSCMPVIHCFPRLPDSLQQFKHILDAWESLSSVIVEGALHPTVATDGILKAVCSSHLTHTHTYTYFSVVSISPSMLPPFNLLRNVLIPYLLNILFFV